MALIGINAQGNAPNRPFDPSPVAKIAPDTPWEALSRLSELHRDANRDLILSQFLARSPLACIAIMLTGALALLWAGLGGGGTLKADFIWASLVLLGVVAITGNVITSHARSPARLSLEAAALRQHMLLLYAGLAWGSGAFWMMPDLPAPALVFSFATMPGLALALLLRYLKGALAFALPAALTTVAAALRHDWPEALPVTAAILAIPALLILFILRRAMGRHPKPAFR